jgi:restriction system protein
MLPLLKYSSDGKEHSIRDAIDSLPDGFNLSEEEKKELLPSGNEPTINSRIRWAKAYLKQAGLLKNTRRGYFKISDKGLSVLKDNPDKIDNKFLKQFSEFVDFKQRRREKDETVDDVSVLEQTPEESIENSFLKIRNDLAQELLELVKNCSPSFFEKLVIDLLVSMGYGGSRRDAGQAIGKSGDEGIDGIIKEDRLGLDIVYLQAKRWENVVGRPEIHKFVGALQGQRAKKGVFITTASFSKDALEYAEKIDPKIVLIDGDRLGELMIDFNIGASPVKSFEIKRVDSDYFTET